MEISWSRYAEDNKRSGQQEASGRRTAVGVEDSVRSWGQQEESRTAGGFQDSGGEEDSGTSWGQWEESRTAGAIKKGSIHYLLKKGCLPYKGSINIHYFKWSSLLARGMPEWRWGHGGSGGQREENEPGVPLANIIFLPWLTFSCDYIKYSNVLV